MTKRMTFIPEQDWLDHYMKANPAEDRTEVQQSLRETMAFKAQGGRCECGEPIWAAGSAVCGSLMCFSCITGEADASDEYEAYLPDDTLKSETRVAELML